MDLRERADRLVRDRVQRADLALAFDETVASTVDVHVGGRNFFPLILRDIAAASSSLHINQFGFRPGAIGEQFATALLEKAAQGVVVRMVVDGSGSRPDRSGREFYGRLRDGGIDVRVVRAMSPRAGRLDHLGHPDHRKVFVIDGRIGWVGGAGVEDHFDDGRFHDLFVRFTGPLVSQLQLVFVASYRWLGGDVPQDAVDALFPPDAAGAVPAIVLHNAPGKYRPITAAIADLFEQARDSLDVVNPYLVDRKMIERIVAAARRGVAVRLFVPGKPNNWFCASAQRHHHATLLDAGVRILEHPSMLHAKAFARDGEEVLVGTCNLEAWSLKRSFEIDVLVRSHEFAAQFDERFSTAAEAVSGAGRAPTGANRFVAAALARLSPLL